MEGQWALSVCCFLCGLQSREQVGDKITNPFKPPYVNLKYLSDKRNILMMSEGVRFAEKNNDVERRH